MRIPIVKLLKYKPLPSLLKSKNRAILAFVQRDLLEKNVLVNDLWQLPEPKRILKRQMLNGSWLYPAGKEKIRSEEDYNQIETYRNLGILIEEFGFNKTHPAIQRAAEYLFTFQTEAGDFRGIYGNQYSPNYSAGITELLIKAGYEDDPRVRKVFEWLISIRQKDNGWAIPFRTRVHKINIIGSHSKPVEPDISKPFSHMVTGVVLRAFAAHPAFRQSKEAYHAGQLLLSNLFKRDNYGDRAAAEYWLRFTFPFWYTDLISALDSLSLLGFKKEDPRLGQALKWFIENQLENGLWELKITKGRDNDTIQLWLALAICKIFKRLNVIL